MLVHPRESASKITLPSTRERPEPPTSIFTNIPGITIASILPAHTTRTPKTERRSLAQCVHRKMLLFVPHVRVGCEVILCKLSRNAIKLGLRLVQPNRCCARHSHARRRVHEHTVHYVAVPRETPPTQPRGLSSQARDHNDVILTCCMPRDSAPPSRTDLLFRPAQVR